VNATNLKVSGVHVFSAGDFLGAPGTESVVLSDQGLGTYRKLVIAGGRVVGAVLYGDTATRFGISISFVPAPRSIPSARISFSVEHWASGLERPASARRNS
jgi:NAD(P)H-nitrite reductase large subunit